MKHHSPALRGQNLLFSTVPETNFSIQMDEALRLYENNPAIEASIIADQDKHAMQKKAMREKDRLWVSNCQMLLIESTACAVADAPVYLNG